MAKGDHLEVDTKYSPFIQHHGIDVGDGTVIHFKKKNPGDRKKPSDILPIIMKTSMEDFHEGRKVTVVPHSFCLPADKVVERAEKILQCQNEMKEKLKYNPVSFNCEHLANLCKMGEVISHQVDEYKTYIALAAIAGIVIVITREDSN